jgi:hypothetical protein
MLLASAGPEPKITRMLALDIGEVYLLIKEIVSRKFAMFLLVSLESEKCFA